MNKSMKCIILIFAVIMIMVITGLGFCKGRNQEKITKEKKIEKAENGEKTTKYVNNEVTKDKQTGIEQNRCAMACQGCGIAIFCFL